MLSISNNERKKMKLYKLSNEQYLWSSLMLETPCASLREVFHIGTKVLQLPIAEIELCLITMQELDHNVAIFEYPQGIFIRTERNNN